MHGAAGTGAILAVLFLGSPSFPGVVMSLDLASMEEGVLEAIELIRPALQSDGGDIVFQFIDEDGVVHVSLVGACGTCPVSMMTLKAGVERIIMDRVPGVTEVVADE
jgi:Fe-S cluster biogenesis protein NfuA